MAEEPEAAEPTYEAKEEKTTHWADTNNDGVVDDSEKIAAFDAA
jgi:hypothetical protein